MDLKMHFVSFLCVSKLINDLMLWLMGGKSLSLYVWVVCARVCVLEKHTVYQLPLLDMCSVTSLFLSLTQTHIQYILILPCDQCSWFNMGAAYVNLLNLIT